MDDDVNLVVAEIFEKSKKPEIKQIKKQQKTDPLSIVENKPENTSVINRVVEKKVGNQDLNIEEVEEPRTLKNKETVYEGLFIIPRIKTENLNIIESEPEPEIIVATSEKLLIELPKISELKKESKQLAQSILDNDITLIYQKSIETTEKVQDKPATKTIELFDNETVTEDIEDYVELLISEAITNKAQDDDVEPLDETIEEVIIDENESKPLLADDEFNETGGYYLKQDSLISKEVIKTRSHTFLSVDDDSEIDDNILPIPTRPLSRSVTSSFTTTTNKNYKSDNFISRRLASLVLRMVISKI